jgi:hypothetical protein
MDITNETVITLDSKLIPVQLIRALGETSSRLRIERDDASVEEIEVIREVTGFTFRRLSLSRAGTEQNPVEMEFRAELLSADGQRKWVSRGGPEHINLLAAGWQENGRSKGRIAPSNQAIQAQVEDRKAG